MALRAGSGVNGKKRSKKELNENGGEERNKEIVTNNNNGVENGSIIAEQSKLTLMEANKIQANSRTLRGNESFC